MDNVCQYVNRIINIDAERESYTKVYDCVRNNVINGLKEDANFKELFRDLKLCGSYADNLKVSKPDEFDLAVCLEFPYNELVEISPDNMQRGNVFINLSKVLVRLENDKNKIDIRKFLNGMVDSKKYFLEDKFQNWLQGRVASYLQKIDGKLRHTDGVILSLRYYRQGPAHTIYVDKIPHELSIDFVPVFQFTASKSISKRKVTATNWQAVPKPMGVKGNKSFRTSYTESERPIFANKNQFKATLRMMKKFRDTKPKMVNLKSYHLKTLFLWHNETCAANFWTKPTIEIIHEMFSVLETALSRQEIPYFWDRKLNLLEKCSSTQITSMFHEVRAATRILKQPRGNFASIFLTEQEQKEYAEYQGTEEADMDEMCQKISRIINMESEKDSGVSTALELLKNQLLSYLKDNNEFCKIYSDFRPSGSYTDNLRVSKTNKFKHVMCFKFPVNAMVTIIPSNTNRRDISIDLSNVLNHLEQQKEIDAHKFLGGMLNSRKWLLADKFQNWFQGRISNFLRKTCDRLTFEDGSTASLQYRRCDPAHKIKVSNSKYTFSIDIVPSFLISANKAPTKRPVTSDYFLAYPKPAPQNLIFNSFFSVSYEESERKIFANKNQFKNILRIMKKFCTNKPPMVNLNTYHLKTVFLWHNEECATNFWSQPSIDILHVMFKKLQDALDRHEIPFFWWKKENLLKELNYNQIESMLQEVRRARYILLHAASTREFLNIFLTEEEISRVHPMSPLNFEHPRLETGQLMQSTEEPREEGLSTVIQVVGVVAAVASILGVSYLNYRTRNND